MELEQTILPYMRQNVFPGELTQEFRLIFDKKRKRLAFFDEI